MRKMECSAVFCSTHGPIESDLDDFDPDMFGNRTLALHAKARELKMTPNVHDELRALCC